MYPYQNKRGITQRLILCGIRG